MGVPPAPAPPSAPPLRPRRRRAPARLRPRAPAGGHAEEGALRAAGGASQRRHPVVTSRRFTLHNGQTAVK